MPEYAVPCLFGLEGPAAEELRRMGLEDVRAENGRVRFSGGPEAMVRANLRLRTGERVLLSLGSFEAKSFEELFQGVKALPLSDYIPKDGQFPVKGHCLRSALHSVPDCQRIIKKAAAVNLGRSYHTEWLPENGDLYQLQFSLMNDRAEIYLDTTGPALFKRGYRPGHVAAPLRETLAAALVGFSRYRGRDDFYDPFCGSGTIAIEAALIARNRAPGLHRAFSAEKWSFAPAKIWQEERETARTLEYHGDYRIYASDIDPRAVALSRENARRAGVERDIRFAVADARSFLPAGAAGVIVTNPPYGERMLEKQQARELLEAFGRRMEAFSAFRKLIISSEADFERYYGRRADKKRKLYNGMLPCQLFIYNTQ